LRVLLLNVKGSKSYDEIKTVNGSICKTFHEAAQKLGLLDDDQEWSKCLDEAASWETNAERLRELFSIILTQCQPSNPHQLWDHFKDQLSCDILYKQKQRRNDENFQPDEQTYHTALYLLNRILNKLGKSLKDYQHMPHFDTNKILRFEQEHESDLISEELNYNSNEESEYLRINLQHLNSDQAEIFKYVTEKKSNCKLRFEV
jgi:hypothetical protein